MVERLSHQMKCLFLAAERGHLGPKVHNAAAASHVHRKEVSIMRLSSPRRYRLPGNLSKHTIIFAIFGRSIESSDNIAFSLDTALILKAIVNFCIFTLPKYNK